MSEHHRRLEAMYHGAPANQIHDPELTVDHGTATVRMEAVPTMHHAAEAVHGAYLFKLLDDAAFFAANSLVEDVFVLTVSFDLHFLRPVSHGILTGHAEVLHPGDRLIVAQATVENEDGKQVARGTGTFMASRLELGPELGYA